MHAQVTRIALQVFLCGHQWFLYLFSCTTLLLFAYKGRDAVFETKGFRFCRLMPSIHCVFTRRQTPVSVHRRGLRMGACLSRPPADCGEHSPLPWLVNGFGYQSGHVNQAADVALLSPQRPRATRRHSWRHFSSRLCSLFLFSSAMSSTCSSRPTCAWIHLEDWLRQISSLTALFCSLRLDQILNGFAIAFVCIEVFLSLLTLLLVLEMQRLA